MELESLLAGVNDEPKVGAATVSAGFEHSDYKFLSDICIIG